MSPVTTNPIDTTIIGAGLSGIYAASLLAERNNSFVVLEARNRIGGRILCPAYQNHPVCEIERCTNGVQVTIGELEKAPRTKFIAQKVIIAILRPLSA